jgi:mono/diheme cytochrome c family protein
VTLNGTVDLVIEGIPSPYPMPKYATVLTDRDIADVLTFIREGWSNGASAVSPEAVGRSRRGFQD